MQWLIDTVMDVWHTLHPRIDGIESIAPTAGKILRGDGDHWVGDPYDVALRQFPRFIWRGDPGAADYTQATMTLDGNKHDLDLSGIVPQYTIAVAALVTIRAPTIGKTCQFFHPDNTNLYNQSQMRIQVANQFMADDLIIFCSTDRKISYKYTAGTWFDTFFLVKGWWVA